MGQDVILASDVSLGAFVVLGDGVRIGARTRVHDLVCVGDGVEIGADCTLQSSCVLQDGVRLGDRVSVGPGTVIGSDGFGFVEDGGIHHKIPQVGGVAIEDDVMVGANVCIDRGTTTDTRIGRASRIASSVQIGHNVLIGERCQVDAQTGIAGSCTLEDEVRLGAAVGTLPHQTIRRGAVLEARSGVTKEVPPQSHLTGYPMRPVEEHRWLQQQLDRVPELVNRLAAAEARLGLRSETPP